MNKIKTIIENPIWSFVGTILGILVFFGFGVNMITHAFIQYFILAIALFLAVHGSYRLWKQKSLHDIIESTKKQSISNNPDLFPELNETVLKKNISIKMRECHNNQLIRNICLYHGDGNNQYKYNVVIEVIPSVGFEEVGRFWGGEAPYVLGDSFVEVYRKKPESILQFQEGSFWNDWDTIVVYSLDEIPDSFIMKNDKWLLYHEPYNV